jgi:hypothetical protein
MVKCGVLFDVRTEFLNNYFDELRLQGVNKAMSVIMIAFNGIKAVHTTADAFDRPVV